MTSIHIVVGELVQYMMHRNDVTSGFADMCSAIGVSRKSQALLRLVDAGAHPSGTLLTDR
jgi:hypothetical protein